MDSVRAEGIQSPLIVVIDGHPDGVAYVLEGAHRLAAAEELRLPSLPALVVYDNSADPVVRDNNGNVIPLSQRFNR
jgi:ParB-like chromosome segregation protein Spo0J